jgi:hypothetical protein
MEQAARQIWFSFMHGWPPIRNGVTRLGGLNEGKIESVITGSPFRKETRTPRWLLKSNE